jgi:hypothetical protein
MIYVLMRKGVNLVLVVRASPKRSGVAWYA